MLSAISDILISSLLSAISYNLISSVLSTKSYILISSFLVLIECFIDSLQKLLLVLSIVIIIGKNLVYLEAMLAFYLCEARFLLFFNLLRLYGSPYS